VCGAWTVVENSLRTLTLYKPVSLRGHFVSVAGFEWSSQKHFRRRLNSGTKCDQAPMLGKVCIEWKQQDKRHNLQSNQTRIQELIHHLMLRLNNWVASRNLTYSGAAHYMGNVAGCAPRGIEGGQTKRLQSSRALAVHPTCDQNTAWSITRNLHEAQVSTS
jgi:hypothetical protein